MWRKSWCIIRPCEQGWCHSGKHIIHSQIPSCFTCLLRLLWDKLWFLSPPSHFLIGAQWVMTFWWLNMETGCKCLSLSSCWPQPVRLLSCWKEIQCTLFSAFCHSSHSISYFGLWQVPPAQPSLFTNCQGAPRRFPPSPSEDGDTFCWFTSCLTGKRATYVWRLLALLANDPVVGKALVPDSRVRWGLQRVSAGAECVMCASLLPWQW